MGQWPWKSNKLLRYLLCFFFKIIILFLFLVRKSNFLLWLFHNQILNFFFTGFLARYYYEKYWQDQSSSFYECPKHVLIFVLWSVFKYSYGNDCIYWYTFLLIVRLYNLYLLVLKCLKEHFLKIVMVQISTYYCANCQK